MLTSAVFHLQGIPFNLVSVQKPAPQKDGFLFGVQPLVQNQACQNKPVALVGMAWVSSNCWCRSALRRHFRFNICCFQQQCVACIASGVLNLGNCCCGLGRGMSTQAVGHSVAPEMLSKSRRVREFVQKVTLLLSTQVENPIKVNETSLKTTGEGSQLAL